MRALLFKGEGRLTKSHHLIVGSQFDFDGELKVRAVSTTAVGSTGTAWLSRRQVAALRDHLSTLLGDTPVETHPPFTLVDF